MKDRLLVRPGIGMKTTCRTGFHNSDVSAATLVLRTFIKHVDDPTTWAPSPSYWGWTFLSFRPMWVAEP